MDELREIFTSIESKLKDLFNRVNQLEATPVVLSGGGGGGAPIDAQYLTIALNGMLTQERRFAPSARFNATDGGAGADYDLDLAASGVGAGAYGSATQVATFTVDTYGRLTVAANVAISGVPPLAHNILSVYHSDTLADNVVDGDIIIGNVTPKWSRLAISIPAANVRNVLGIDNGELRPSWKTALDGTNPSAITVGAAASPGTSLVFSHRDHTHASPATWTPSAHNLLSASHGDTTVQGVTRGSLIYGDATPTWNELVFPGGANRILTTNATDVLWSTNTLNITGNSTINGSLVGNMTGSGTIATGGFTLTVPATGTAVLATRNIATTAPLTGGGTLAADLTLDITDATDSAVGVVELATTAEVQAGTDASRVVTPAGLRADVPTTPAARRGVRLDASGNLWLPEDGAIGITGDVRTVYDNSGGYINERLGDNAGADEWRVLDSGGVAVATVDSDGNGYFAGNVGIGTTSPGASRFIAQHNQNATSNFRFSNTDTTNTSSRADFRVIGGDNVFRVLTINGDATYIGSIGSGGNLVFQSGGTNNNMILDSSGNVGIGTTSPCGKTSIDQNSTTAAIPVLELDQADVSEEFINFIVAATGAGNPVDTATAVGTTYARLRVAVNGTFKYIQLYNA